MKLKICSYNLENLYLGLEKFSGHNLEEMTEKDFLGLSVSTINTNKPLFKVLELCKTIKEIDADVYCLQEVMSKTSLVNLNKYFLEDRYEVVLEEENSNRSIYVGFLIRKGIQYEVESFSKRKLKDGSYASRNLTSLVVLEKDIPILSLLGVHLKSKRPDEKKTNTYSLRELEVDLLSSVQAELSERHGCPVIILGDFNANFNLEPEFTKLNRVGYVDFVKIKYGDEYEKHGTFTTNYLEMKVQQLDFILIQEEYLGLVDLNESGIHLYRNEYGDKITLPYNKIERQFLPSDHCPIFLNIKVISQGED